MQKSSILHIHFAYQAKIKINNTVYLLHRAYSEIDRVVSGSGAVRIMFFVLTSTFNAIQPTIKNKLTEIKVDPRLMR